MKNTLNCIADFDPEMVATLQDFEMVNSSVIDSGNLSALSAVICKYKLNDCIGLGLLHKHFSIGAGERLLRYVTGNCMVTYPKVASEQPVAYYWKVQCSTNDSSAEIYPLEFLSIDNDPLLYDKISGIVDRVKRNKQFWEEMATLLTTLNLTQILGICILNKCFISRKEDEVFLETTDDINRILNLAPVSGNSDLSGTTLTQWEFSQKNGSISTHCSHCGHKGGVCWHR